MFFNRRLKEQSKEIVEENIKLREALESTLDKVQGQIDKRKLLTELRKQLNLYNKILDWRFKSKQPLPSSKSGFIDVINTRTNEERRLAFNLLKEEQKKDYDMIHFKYRQHQSWKETTKVMLKCDVYIYKYL